MQLRLESRPVGDVLIVQCHGRIVAGNEVFTLHSSVHFLGMISPPILVLAYPALAIGIFTRRGRASDRGH